MSRFVEHHVQGFPYLGDIQEGVKRAAFLDIAQGMVNPNLNVGSLKGFTMLDGSNWQHVSNRNVLAKWLQKPLPWNTSRAIPACDHIARKPGDGAQSTLR